MPPEDDEPEDDEPEDDEPEDGARSATSGAVERIVHDAVDGIKDLLQPAEGGTKSGATKRPTARDLEEELRPIGMFVVLNFIWSLIRAKLAKRLLFIDEAWIMMQNDDSATFLFGLVKRARKYFLGVSTITQDV